MEVRKKRERKLKKSHGVATVALWFTRLSCVPNLPIPRRKSYSIS